jgi:hypothetical protein
MEHINRPYVYLITDCRYYKIGKSLNPFKRLKQLRTANPNCELLGYSKKYTEKTLHKRYKKWKVSGEWYNLPQYEVEHILLVMRSPKKKRSHVEFKKMEMSNYVVPYGEYKGRKLNTMNSVDEIRYLRKQIRELPRLCEEWVMFTRWNKEWIINNPVK